MRSNSLTVKRHGLTLRSHSGHGHGRRPSRIIKWINSTGVGVLLIVETTAAMRSHVGKKLGVSEWVLIDQKMVDQFAQTTGDHQWIHVDVERARREMPDGKTLAHGYLLVSLLPRLMAEIFKIEKRSRSLNYGSNKVRFIAPVQTGARVRLNATLQAFDDVAGGARFTYANTLELEGAAKPAMVAETVSIVYD